MKNVKLTLATTLSILTLAFSGAAFADGDGDHGAFYEQYAVADTSSTNQFEQEAELIRALPITRDVAEQTPIEDELITEAVVNKPVKIYSVRSGDTLMKISRETGLSVLELARLNDIKFEDLNHIEVGQIIKLS